MQHAQVQSLVFGFLLALLGGCGGGGGPGLPTGSAPGAEGPGDGSDPGALPPEPGPEPFGVALGLDGPAYASVGTPLTARLMADAYVDDPADALVVDGPAGLRYDPSDGRLTWTPRAGQEGLQRVQFSLTNEEGRRAGYVDIQVEGRELLGALGLTASAGGSVQVTLTGHPLRGSRIVVPAGAVTGPNTLRVERVIGAARLPVGANAVEVTPALRLARAAEVSLAIPGTDALSSASGQPRYAMALRDVGTGRWRLATGSVLDPTTRRITASVTDLATLAVVSTALSEPALGSTPVQVLDGYQSLWQSRRLTAIKTSTLAERASHVLIIHGYGSSTAHLGNLVAWARTRYDAVWTYDYPSFQSIQSNAEWLSQALIEQLPKGAILDIVAHSMGGIVARAVVEHEKIDLLGESGITLNNLATLGTPHRGTAWAYPAPGPGTRDIRPGSQLLAVLNAAPGQGWTRYLLLAGTGDAVVSVDSAKGAPGVLERTRVLEVAGAGHSELHEQMNQNGVAGFLSTMEVLKHVEDRVSVQATITPPTVRLDGSPPPFQNYLVSGRMAARVRIDLGRFVAPLASQWVAVLRPAGTTCQRDSVEQEHVVFLVDEHFGPEWPRVRQDNGQGFSWQVVDGPAGQTLQLDLERTIRATPPVELPESCTARPRWEVVVYRQRIALDEERVEVGRVSVASP